MQIATSVVQALQDPTSVDAVQPMRTGWCIYVHTQADRNRLVKRGLTVAGKFVTLCSEYRSNIKESVKITLKDLPLHAVDNESVLKAVRPLASVLSPVNYSNVWYNRKMTNICNGDCFVYIEAKDMNTFPSSLQIGEYVARVFKPYKQEICKRSSSG